MAKVVVSWVDKLESFLSSYAHPVEDFAVELYKNPKKTAEGALATSSKFVQQHPHAVIAMAAGALTLGYLARRAYKEGWWSKLKSQMSSNLGSLSVKFNSALGGGGINLYLGKNPNELAEQWGSLQQQFFSGQTSSVHKP